MPKRVKYRKSQRGSRKRHGSRNIDIAFGEYALQTLETRLDHETRRSKPPVGRSTRNMKRKGKLWIKIFPANP